MEQLDKIDGLVAALRKYAGTMTLAQSEPAKVKSMLLAIANMVEALVDREEGKGMKERVEEAMAGVKDELKETMKKEMEEMRKETGEMMKGIMETMKASTPRATQATQRPTYSTVAAAAGAMGGATDARTVARKVIQARQIRLTWEGEGGRIRKESKPKEIRTALEDTIEFKGQAHKIKTIQREKGEAIVEMDNEEGAQWLREELDNEATKKDLGVTVEGRKWYLMLKFVPITFDREKELEEMLEENGIDQRHVPQARWTKKEERRTKEQTVAHLSLTVTNENTLNYILAKGLIVHQEWKQAVKMKQEPIRCFRCQGWGHIGRDCAEEKETCRTCGEQTHETKDCKNADKRFCKPCNKDGHSSWDQQCPTFLQKCQVYDKRHPENTMPFAPSAELWTWTAGTGTQSQLSTQQQLEIRAKPGMQRARKTDLKERALANEAAAQRSWEERLAQMEAVILKLAKAKEQEPVYAS
jgi:hypothetical protein